VSIEIRNVGKRFGDFVALDDVSLHIPTGQLTALLGPSGGGKSTLLRIIAGLEHADQGSVSIEGLDATHLPAQKRNVGFVFQHYAAFKHLSVFRNVAFGLEIRKVPKDQIRARVHELLELVHLSQFADRLPSQLSGGPGPSPSSRRCSSSTSPSAPSTPRSARSCATGCGASTTRSTSRRCS
jgi:sulfate/thiosulfate transport system ATP-binding protein